MTRPRPLLVLIVLGLLVDGWLAANGALWYRTADFFCLREGARLLGAGADPYDPQAWRPVIEALSPDPFRGSATSSCVARYASPLWTAVVMLPFGVLPLELSASLWMAVSIGGVVLGMHWIWAAVGGSLRLAPVFAASVVASQPFWLLLVGGQVSVCSSRWSVLPSGWLRQAATDGQVRCWPRWCSSRRSRARSSRRSWYGSHCAAAPVRSSARR